MLLYLHWSVARVCLPGNHPVCGALALRDMGERGLACPVASADPTRRAVPLYREALERGGLTGDNRRRAVIQMCSSLRDIGEAETALTLLTAELENGDDHLDDALRGTMALCLSSLGRDREGLSLVVIALAKRLPRYNRSTANYGRLLLDQ